MSDRLRTFLLSIAFIGIPLGLDLFATRTRIGPVLLIFPWSEHAGLHVGDAVCMALLLPLWLMVTIKLVRGDSRQHIRGRP